MSFATRAALVLRPHELKSHDRGGGARTTPLISRAHGATAFINGITEFAGGASVPFHKHNCDESVLILEGEAILDIAGEEHRLAVHDVTWIPMDVPHRFRNASATRPMKILWTYASVNATRTLMDTGDTRPIAAEHQSQS